MHICMYTSYRGHTDFYTAAHVLKHISLYLVQLYVVLCACDYQLHTYWPYVTIKGIGYDIRSTYMTIKVINPTNASMHVLQTV